MARPIKQGFDYFPLDKDFFENIKVRKIMHASGIQGSTVLLYLLCNIYGDHGYYMQWDEDVCFLVSDRLVGVSEAAVQEIVTKAVKVDFFDSYMLDKFKILTSNGIQSRYKEMAKRTKKPGIKKVYDLDLVNTTETEVNDDGTPVNVTETPVNVTFSTQSKVNESKVNKSNKDSHNSKHDKRVYESDDINFKLAQLLLSKIEEQNPDHKKPDLQKWANDIRLMHEQDNRSYDKIQKMIDWSQNNDFWSSNVLSATKLRKQYDTMAAQANNEAKGKTTGYHKKSGRIEAATDWDKVKAKKPSQDNSNALQDRLAKIRGKQDATN